MEERSQRKGKAELPKPECKGRGKKEVERDGIRKLINQDCSLSLS